MSEMNNRLRDLEKVVYRYLDEKQDKPAAVAVISVYTLIETLMAVSAGKTGEDVAMAARRSLVELFFGLTVNPFFQQHGNAFFTTVSLTLSSIFDSAKYAADAEKHRERRDEEKARSATLAAMSAGNELANILISALVLTRGNPALSLDQGYKIRNDLSGVD